MEIEVITSFNDFLKLENVWDAVLERSLNDDLYLTFGWFKAWWLGFGKGRQMHLLVIKKGDAIIGFAPLMISSAAYRNFPVRELGFMQNNNSPGADFIITGQREEAIRAIIAHISAADSWDIVHFKNIPEYSVNYAILVKVLHEKGLLHGIKKGLSSPFLKIESDWETYFSTRTRKFRKVIRNKVNRMKKMGEYDIRIVERVAEGDDTLESIFKISRESWKAPVVRDIIGSIENINFFTELSKTASGKGWLKIWLLSFGSCPAAYEYHLVYKGKIYALRSDYDEKFQASSPGSILDLHIIEHIFSGNASEYNMCGSSDFYKLNWTSDVKEHSRVMIFKDTVYGKMLYFLEFKVISTLRKYQPVRRLRSVFIHA